MSLNKTLRAMGRPIRRGLFEFFGSDRYSRFALNGLDHLLRDRIALRGGFFIEAGANDGLNQSNSYFFEKFRGWRGLLIEPLPVLAARCRINRPRALVANVALVGDASVKSVRIASLNLMSKVTTLFISDSAQREYEALARSVQNLEPMEHVEAPARTLSSVLDELGICSIDLFSLDVEGYETEVLRGLDLSRHAPVYLLVETKVPDAILAMLGERYELVDRLTHHDYLFRLKPSAV